MQVYLAQGAVNSVPGGWQRELRAFPHLWRDVSWLYNIAEGLCLGKVQWKEVITLTLSPADHCLLCLAAPRACLWLFLFTYGITVLYPICLSST